MKYAPLALGLVAMFAALIAWTLFSSPSEEAGVIPVVEQSASDGDLVSRTTDITLPAETLGTTEAVGSRELIATTGEATHSDSTSAIESVEPEPEGLRLIGKVLLEDGTPFSSKQLHLAFRGTDDANRIHKGKAIMTSMEGMFSFSVNAAQTRLDDAMLWDGAKGRKERSYEFQLEGDLPETGVIDLGEVVLTGLYLLASGRVVESGLGGVAVPLVLRARLPVDGRWVGYGHNEEERDFRAYAERRWLLESDQDGSFAFWGKTEVDELILRCDSKLHLGEAYAEVSVGQQGIHLEIERGGHILYSVPEVEALFPMRNCSSFTASVDRIDGRNGSSIYNVFYEYGALKQGTHRVGFYLGWNRENLIHEVQAEIVAGETTDLGEIRFSKHLYHYELEVGTPDGQHPGNLKIEAVEPEAEVFMETDFNTHWERGVTTYHLFSLAPVEQVRISKDGATQIVTVAEGVTEVTFSP